MWRRFCDGSATSDDFLLIGTVCCSVLQCVAVWCSVLQCISSVLQSVVVCCEILWIGTNNILQHPAAHCNTRQHSATHCNTLQHTATLQDNPNNQFVLFLEEFFRRSWRFSLCVFFFPPLHRAVGWYVQPWHSFAIRHVRYREKSITPPYPKH